MYIELMVKQYVNDEELSELEVQSCDIRHVKCCINKQHVSSFEQSSFEQEETIIMMSNGEQITALVSYKIFKALFLKLN
jgi:competence transcription factor ComK